MLNEGPRKSTWLVAGDVKPPRKFHYRWDDSGSGGEHDGSFWQPEAPHGYTCLGDTSSRSQGRPNRNDFRCVPTECVERISDTTHDGAYVWRDHGSGAEQDAGIYSVPGARTDGHANSRSDQGYNLFRTTRGFHGNHDPFYKIKDECLKSHLPPKKPHEGGDWVSHKWHGYPERNPKYSIFTYLGLVPEGVIQNYETKHKYYFVTSNKDPNNYFIKYYHKTLHKRGNLETTGNSVRVNLTTNRDKREQMWILEYTDPNRVLIKSKATGKYLGFHYYQKWQLNMKLYNNPYGNRTLWTIRSTSTGDKQIKQK